MDPAVKHNDGGSYGHGMTSWLACLLDTVVPCPSIWDVFHGARAKVKQQRLEAGILM